MAYFNPIQEWWHEKQRRGHIPKLGQLTIYIVHFVVSIYFWSQPDSSFKSVREFWWRVNWAKYPSDRGGAPPKEIGLKISLIDLNMKYWYFLSQKVRYFSWRLTWAKCPWDGGWAHLKEIGLSPNILWTQLLLWSNPWYGQIGLTLWLSSMSSKGFSLKLWLFWKVKKIDDIFHPPGNFIQRFYLNMKF